MTELKRVLGVDPSRVLDEVIGGEFKELPDNGMVHVKGGEIFVSHVRQGQSSLMVAPENLDELRAALRGGHGKGGRRSRSSSSFPVSYSPRAAPRAKCRPSFASVSTEATPHKRLFLQQAISGKGANWSSHVVLGRPWWTWSWNQVPG